MSDALKIYLTERVIELYDRYEQTGDEVFKKMAWELNDILNGVLEMRGYVQ